MGFFTRPWRGKKPPQQRAPDAEKSAGGALPRHSRKQIRTRGFTLRTRGDYTLENSDLIFSAVSRLANSLSAMPMTLYLNGEPQKGELSDLVGFEANPSMTAHKFFQTFEACRCTSGNGYALKLHVPGRTQPYLHLLDPARVQPVIEAESKEIWYRINPEQESPYYLHNYYVLHVPFVSTNGLIGVNPISVLQRTLQYQERIEQFSAEQLEKGINAQVVLEAPATLSESQREDTIRDFLDTYKKTSGNILLLEAGVTAKSINLSPIDTKLFEVEKISRSRVANVYNIPPHMLGDFSDTSFSSQEQQMLEFLTLTMLPIVTAYEQEFTRKLLTRTQRQQGYRLKMNMLNLLRADAGTMADVHQKGIRGGWVRPNEARLDDGLPPDPDGDKLLVSRDLTTLEYAIRNPDNGAASSINP